MNPTLSTLDLKLYYDGIVSKELLSEDGEGALKQAKVGPAFNTKRKTEAGEVKA